MRLLYIFILFLFCSVHADAQRVLYFEEMSEVKPRKIYEGQYVDVVLREYPDEWITVHIESLLVDEKTIVGTQGMYRLEDIVKIRFERRWVTPLSLILKTGATTLAVYSTIYGIKDRTVLIGGWLTSGITYGVGWLINKLFKYKTYKIGKKYRLKMLDISLPDPSTIPVRDRL